jgi:hypothetical protein
MGQYCPGHYQLMDLREKDNVMGMESGVSLLPSNLF